MAKKLGFWNDCDSFPIIFKDRDVTIYVNPTNEIFVAHNHTKKTLRISPTYQGFSLTGLEMDTPHPIHLK